MLCLVKYCIFLSLLDLIETRCYREKMIKHYFLLLLLISPHPHTLTTASLSNDLMIGREFSLRTVSTETVINRVFLFSKAGKFKLIKFGRVPYDKLLSHLACSTGSY